MPASTPLDKIDETVPDNQASDEERVQRIIQEMNGGTNSNEPPGREEMMEHPSSQMPPQNPQYQPMPMQPPPHMMNQYMQQMQMQQEQMQMKHQDQGQDPDLVHAPEKQVDESPKKNIWAHITDLLKLPFVVTIVFFLLSLPVVDTYLAKYATWAFSSSGTLTLYGIGIKAVSAGAIMGIYDTLDKLVSRFL